MLKAFPPGAGWPGNGRRCRDGCAGRAPICLRLLVHGHAGGGLADLLDGRQQQADQDGDDGDDDEQFDERERGTSTDHDTDSLKKEH